MKRYLLLLCVVLVGFTIDDTQNDQIILNWSNPLGILSGGEAHTEILENSGFPENTSELPLFTRIYDLQSSGTSYKVFIENAEYESMEWELSPDLLNAIPSGIQINSQLLKSGDSLKNEIRIVPLKNENGKIWRLKSFQLKRYPVEQLKSTNPGHEWKSGSALSSGKWVKIATSGKGIYKIPYSKLKSWGFEQPEKVGVFGSGALPLSEDPGKIDYDDIVQCAVWRNANGGEDCLFFYSPGITKWTLGSDGNFSHYTNDYSRKGYFFLTDNEVDPKTVETLSEITAVADQTVNSFSAYAVLESDLYNLLPLGSGKQWFGQKFSAGTTRNFTFEVADLDESAEPNLLATVAARSYSGSSMSVSVNTTALGTLGFSQVNTDDNTGLYADLRTRRFSFPATGNQYDVALSYNASNGTATAWIDYLELNYRQRLKFRGIPLFFRDVPSLGAGKIVEFKVEEAGSTTRLFDVTDINNVKEVPVELNGTMLSAKRPADELYEYMVFKTDGTFNEPELVGEVENQNLHALATTEYLIITHSNFRSAAEELAAFHRENDGMTVDMVDVDKVYNEFSSGSKDASGIRNFIKMMYDRGNTLKYVLLVGDGSYDNKNINSGNKNFIPTYQSTNSLNPTASFVTDDYFVMLDAGESVYSGAIDLGIGRLPVSTAYEAQSVVDKIKRYHEPAALGSWRNVVTFIGDDEDSGLHMRQAEELADSLNKNNNAFYADKIYFDAYVQEVSPSGDSYPGVNAAINERVKDGVLILNYTGHANERYLAHERVLDISDINAWSNTSRMPIFVTATCEFSRFDGDETSAGEYILLNPNGGGIGLFSTTRLVFASANFKLSKSFYSYIFKNDENGNHYRMGDVMRLAKINIGTSTNKRNFTLLADPALKLSFPKYKVVTSKINQQDANGEKETIGALQKVTIEGYVADAFGNKVDNFNGTLVPTVYDKEVLMETLGNGGETPVKFKVRENIIYKGESSVQNGSFTFSFVVPKDISYSLGEGKIMYYADNGLEDAHGAFENFNIGGAGSEVSDDQGPEIDLYLDSPDFRSGDKTGKNPTLLAYLSDDNGINTVGTGIGHDITAVLDNDYSNVYVLNAYYEANSDDYTSGTLTFPFSNLSVGKHTLRLKVWDVANNSSEKEIEFEVSSELEITDISNYPNPVSDYTFFVLRHNQAGAALDIIFDIYDRNGRSVDRFQTTVGSNGNTTNPIRWDIAESKIAVAPGVYVYRAIVQNSEGVISSRSGKMVVVR
ncbi:type IX secretion system sortase PorU [Maribellus sp. YY47]|uniref:type IX secretion system sortase PorU n=1 Tax=Maribellus sp. YY47 TaxID=2929486 RepID=UPI002001D0B6|nr:type IX secretion system sortase PorU [Maribellus sp. YY47]MCK3685997.1 type IX secretion system sortase PorU [Maribellus sp. YY47]